MAKTLMNGRLRKSEIRKELVAAYEVSWRQADRYVSRARELIKDDLRRSPTEHRADAYSFYRGIIEDPDVAPREKIRAQERIDKLLALEKPQKIVRSGESVDDQQAGVQIDDDVEVIGVMLLPPDPRNPEIEAKHIKPYDPAVRFSNGDNGDAIP